MNREGIRRLAAETLGLPTSPYRFADSLDELQAAIDGNGGRRHRLSLRRQAGDVVLGQGPVAGARPGRSRPPAWQYAESAGRVRGSRVIVEGFIDFDYEITLLTVRTRAADGEAETHFCEPIGHVQVNGDYVESWQPQPMSRRGAREGARHRRPVTAELGGRGLFGVELFVKGDEVWFSEVSPRPHDTGMVTMCTQAQSEFELHARAILGLPVDTRCVAPGASAVIYGGVDARGMRFDDVADALAVPESDLRLFGKPEAYMKRRMGVALATGDDTAQARDAREGMRAAASCRARPDAVCERAMNLPPDAAPGAPLDLVVQAPAVLREDLDILALLIDTDAIEPVTRAGNDAYRAA